MEEEIKKEKKTEEIKKELNSLNDEFLKLANEAAERLEKANLERERILAKEKLERQMSGTIDAGTTPKVTEETPRQYKDRLLRGN